MLLVPAAPRPARRGRRPPLIERRLGPSAAGWVAALPDQLLGRRARRHARRGRRAPRARWRSAPRRTSRRRSPSASSFAARADAPRPARRRSPPARWPTSPARSRSRTPRPRSPSPLALPALAFGPRLIASDRPPANLSSRTWGSLFAMTCSGRLGRSLPRRWVTIRRRPSRRGRGHSRLPDDERDARHRRRPPATAGTAGRTRARRTCPQPPLLPQLLPRRRPRGAGRRPPRGRARHSWPAWPPAGSPGRGSAARAARCDRALGPGRHHGQDRSDDERRTPTKNPPRGRTGSAVPG